MYVLLYLPPNDLLYYHSIIYKLTIMSVVNSFLRVGHQFVQRFRSNNTQASSVLDPFPVVLSTKDFAGLTSGVGLVKLHTVLSAIPMTVFPPSDSLYLIQYYLTPRFPLARWSLQPTNKAQVQS